MCVCRSAPTQAHLPKPVVGGDRRHRAEPTYNHKVRGACRGGEGRGRAAVQGGGRGREGGCWSGGDSDATRQKIALIDKIQHMAHAAGMNEWASTSPINQSYPRADDPGGAGNPGMPSTRWGGHEDPQQPRGITIVIPLATTSPWHQGGRQPRNNIMLTAANPYFPKFGKGKGVPCQPALAPGPWGEGRLYSSSSLGVTGKPLFFFRGFNPPWRLNLWLHPRHRSNSESVTAFLSRELVVSEGV